MMGMTVQAQVLAPKGSIEMKPRLSRYSFCISLNPSANSGAVSYGIHKLAPDSTQEVNFIEEGMLDSFDIVTLVDSIEEEMGVAISGMDVLPENFCSIDAICQTIERNRK